MNKRFSWIAMFAVLAVAIVVAAWPSSGAPQDENGRVQYIASQLRCPTCEGLSMADSESPLSVSSKDEIRRQVQAGSSDRAIKQYFVARYGPASLISPPKSGISLLTLVLPVLGAVVGAGLLLFALRRWRRTDNATPVADADRELVEQYMRGLR